ncbi:MAG: hypothetical protein IKZ38_00080 [Clostridia bacterium]|nr:hypothetical protein [Clostridia bacterium]
MIKENLVNSLNLKLNSVSENRGDFYKNLNQIIGFKSGNFETDLVDFILSVVPNGKVCALYTKKTYSEYGVAFTDLLSRGNVECINVVMKDGKVDDVDRLTHLFNVGEDVRLAIAFDYNLFGAVSYFSTVRNLPCVLAVDSFKVKDALSPYMFLKNGESIDKVRLSCSRTIFIKDKFNYEQNASEAYAHVVSNLTSLIDYRISCVCSQQENAKTSYDLAREAVYSAYGVMNLELGEQENVLLYSALLLELSNYLSNGNLYLSSAVEWAEKSLFFTEDLDYSSRLFIMITVLRFYDVVFEKMPLELMELVDYIKLSEEIAREFPQKQKTIVETLLTQSASIRKRKTELNALIEKLKKEVEALATFAQNVTSTYRALGGEAQTSPEKVLSAIKHSGDLYYLVNGITLLREEGVLFSDLTV